MLLRRFSQYIFIVLLLVYLLQVLVDSILNVRDDLLLFLHLRLGVRGFIEQCLAAGLGSLFLREIAFRVYLIVFVYIVCADWRHHQVQLRVNLNLIPKLAGVVFR